MGLFDKLKKKSLSSYIFELPYNFPVPSHLYHEAFKMNYAVYVCVNKIAKAIAGVKFTIYEKREEGLRELEEHPYQQIFNETNPQTSWTQFVELVMIDYLITGNMYIRKVEGTNRKMLYLYRLNPLMISKEKERYRYGSEVIESSEVMHLMIPNPYDETKGLSPLLVGAPIIEVINNAEKWNANLLKKEGRASGILKVKGHLTAEQREAIREEFRQKYLGYGSIGSPIVAEGDVEWIPLSYSPKEMDWVNSERLSLIKICAIYGVPPELVFEVEHKTYSNYREARKAFYQETVLPILDIFCNALTKFLSMGENLLILYDKDDIESLKEEQGELWKRAIEGWQSGLLTLNEARELLGYSAIEGGDVRIAGGNFVPLSMILPNLSGEESLSEESKEE